MMRILRKMVYLAGALTLIDSTLIAEAPEQAPKVQESAEAQPAEGESSSSETPRDIHERRMEQLRRLRDLAVENERQDMISRADGLIARELKRHSQQVEQVEEPDDAREATVESDEATGATESSTHE